MRRSRDLPNDTVRAAGSEPTAARPWRRPRILERQRIEAMAADCGVASGKSDPTCLVPFS